MLVKFYGTRGSIPVSHPEKVQFGGNTTCLRIRSECLPEGHWLTVDSGTGIVPLSRDFVKANGKEVVVLQTHWHHDHTQGMLLSCFPYMKNIPVRVFGPKEDGLGGRQVFHQIMRPPFFPVEFKEIGSHFRFHDIEHPNSTVLVIHPTGGYKVLKLEEFERMLKEGRQLPFPSRQSFSVEECLVVRMYRNNHPERTISYRFEERPTGQIFVILTDHENMDGIPQCLRRHLEGASLLVMDAQYTREAYDTAKCGFGHGTPDYVAKVARETGISFLGITHHDPDSTDSQIQEIVAVAQSEAGAGIHVFACCDYKEVDLIGTLS